MSGTGGQNRLRRPRLPVASKSAGRVARGRMAHRQGHRGEGWAMTWLMLKGYRILGFRLKTRQGEIDLLARKGRVLVIAEVKRRASLEAALAALGPDQQGRLMAAGQALLRQRPSLQGYRLRLDLIALVPGRFPIHVQDLIAHRGARV